MDGATAGLIIGGVTAAVAVVRWAREDSKTAVDTMHVAMTAETARADREHAEVERLRARVEQLEQALRDACLPIPPERRVLHASQD